LQTLEKQFFGYYTDNYFLYCCDDETFKLGLQEHIADSKEECIDNKKQKEEDEKKEKFNAKFGGIPVPATIILAGIFVLEAVLALMGVEMMQTAIKIPIFLIPAIINAVLASKCDKSDVLTGIAVVIAFLHGGVYVWAIAVVLLVLYFFFGR